MGNIESSAMEPLKTGFFAGIAASVCRLHSRDYILCPQGPKGKCPPIKLGSSAACMSLQKRCSTGLSTGNGLIWGRLPFMDSLTVTVCSWNLRRMMGLTFTWGGAG